MTNEKLEQFKKRVEKDYNELINKFKGLEKSTIINSAYEIACYNEIADLCDDEDTDYLMLDERTIDLMISFEGNTIQKIWVSWLNYRHPERYNFFTREDLIGIINYAFIGEY